MTGRIDDHRASDRLAGLPADRRALFEQLRARRAATAASPADHPPVPLRPGDGPARLVLLHPSGGALFCYTPLVRALRADIDVIGFAADPADRGLPPGQRIPVVARRLLTALRQVADPARCILSGWSHGGALAFEIARRHAASGAPPPGVVLLDCSYYGDIELDDEATLRRNFVYDLARLAGRDHAEVAAALDPLDLGAMDLRAILDAARLTVALTDAELAGRYETFRDCALALESYCPAAPFGGDVTLLVAERAREIEARWRTQVTGRLTCTRLPGDHYTLFTPPVLPLLITAIEAATGPPPSTDTETDPETERADGLRLHR
jgi:thioesterase domain-containing protein